ncbi:FAD-binding protein [Paenisporosarcina cavernae]|uniref:FAD-binding oxidoreductase n=1 Tax=Paenisporosarcina cavernae TaxID=2320858 RepID=A0A385YY83_9BACL|nr:FAD-binding oxidoreductase [Paenisporosarcina cavernae]AYC30493.1 FAD-binding oxidoreductase [Paenisporosarcina cavernae]
MKKSVLIILAYLTLFAFTFFHYQKGLEIMEENDYALLLPTQMKVVTDATSDQALQKIVHDAAKSHTPISIAGMQHSQGGQTLYPNGIQLDMKGYNDILDLDKESKQITVQSGATWNDIQAYIQPYGLALQVTQSQNIFTVGGSLSVNVHGRDIAFNSLIDSVESFRLLTADGSILDVSRSENSELFYSAIGGYGLVGVILDVTLRLTKDVLYEMKTQEMDNQTYSTYFKEDVLGNSDVQMHMARISTAPDSFLTEMYATDYYLAEDQSKLSNYSKLSREKIIAIPKLFLGLARMSDRGKNLFWATQKTYTEKTDGDFISRNNSMRSDSIFMEMDSAKKTEVLQEYFVPIDAYGDYIDDLRETLEDYPELNMLNITVRYVKENEEATLSYAKEDMFALVILLNQGTDEESIVETQEAVQAMIDVTLSHGGTYYLPYYGYPSKAQFQQAYPSYKDFLQTKKRFDPENLFQNRFYEEYLK